MDVGSEVDGAMLEGWDIIVRRVAGVVAIIAGVAITLAGGIAAWAVWAVMATYPDNVSNTLFQNLSPLLLFGPAAGMGAALAWIGWEVWRRTDLE